jgi:hypothetical protein
MALLLLLDYKLIKIKYYITNSCIPCGMMRAVM